MGTTLERRTLRDIELMLDCVLTYVENANGNNNIREENAQRHRVDAGLHSDKQYGFIKGRGTEDAIRAVIGDISSFRQSIHPRARIRKGVRIEEIPNEALSTLPRLS